MARAKKAQADAPAAAPIVAVTTDYERWLRQRVDVVEADIETKHKLMTGSLFAFLRATFYRWASLWPEVCPDLAKAPRLLAVGDLHVENFGTWRDAEGRLVWGVNDFDEVANMPYAVDLARLVTSVMLAKHENELAIDAGGAATAVLEGYTEALEAGGNPFILEESHPGLRAMALGAERDPNSFLAQAHQARSRDAAQAHTAAAGAVAPRPGRRRHFRAPHRRGRQPWPATLRCHGARQWRSGRARG